MRVALLGLLLTGCGFHVTTEGAIDAPPVVTDAPDDGALLCATPPTGLIAWWPGDTAAEIVGNRTTVLVNGAMAGTTGKVDGAFDFDGVNDRVDVVTDLPPLTVFTIEGWVDFGTITASWRTVFANDGIGPGFWMKDRRVCWFQGSDRFVSTATISATGWHHFALVYGSDQIFRGYADGVAAGTASYAGAFLPNGATIGGYGGYEFDGQIDELSIYDRALSGSEIGAIVAAGANGKCR